ncbi:MAG: hypothetical protein J6X14_05845 [Lachnospiraceae bacterium]|nr:hypothetical protein [Lachnospiraceae bacterium]MBP5669815.1 hypothetical protein [Lachnospiraceae bacterium]
MEIESQGRKGSGLKWLFRIMALGGCFVAAVKLLFVGFGADEEYQLVLAYRLAKGDMLFREVWDTLQTSAFYGQFLTWVFASVTHGTTGLLLFLRFCGILTQAGVAAVLYATLRKHVSGNSAFYVSVVYFCVFTKLLATPEFSNLQSWSLTLLLCFLWRAKDALEAGKKRAVSAWIVASALCYCVAVLSSFCVILIPVIAVLLVRLGKKEERGALKWNLWFWGTCFVCGAAYLLMLLCVDGADALMAGIRGILGGDDTHATGVLLSGNSKLLEYGKDLVIVALALAAALGMARVISKAICAVRSKAGHAADSKAEPKSLPVSDPRVLFLLVSLLTTLFLWLVMGFGYDGLKLYLPALALLGASACFNKKKKNEEMLIPLFGIWIGIGTFLNVLIISNVDLITNLTFLSGAAVWGLVLLVRSFEDGKNEAATRLVLFATLVTVLLGSVYTLGSGPAGNNLAQLFRNRGKIQEGPAKGTYVSREIAGAYNENCRMMKGLVKEGSSVLLVTNFFHNESLTLLYMMNDVKISHYSVNSTMTYGDKLFEYWERFPDRKPGCIIINGDSCFYEDFLWTQKLLETYGEMEEMKVYNVTYYILPKNKK